VVKKLKSQATDEYLFRQEVGDVVPLKTPPRSNSKVPRTQNRKPRREAVAASITPTYLPLTQDQTHIDAEDGSSHRKNGVQKRVIQRLKRGQFPTGGELDLHHMNVASGHTALLEFIADARDRKVACVRIIHGKGLRSKDGPRLKLMTRQTLRDHPGVLAFNTCKPADGGSGAVDVLLKAP
jgi:DNA-nicking Smr family endonuclease